MDDTNRLGKAVHFFWRLAGWQIIGQTPQHLKKYVIIAAPHTSNWDFIIGLCVRSILGFRSHFLGKKPLFRPPLGWIFRILGGIPVDRSQRSNLVDVVSDLFNSRDSFVIAIAPEGTRTNVSDWKTGFYHISFKANVPIVRVKIDRKNKVVTVYEPYYIIGDLDQDMTMIKKVYK